MKAVVIERPHQVDWVELETPTAGPGEVVVRSHAAGVGPAPGALRRSDSTRRREDGERVREEREIERPSAFRCAPAQAPAPSRADANVQRGSRR